MIEVIAKFTIKETHTEKAISLLKQAITPTRAEDSNLKYHLVQDTEKKNVLILLEQWKNLEGLHQHFEMPHFKALISDMEPLLASQTELYTTQAV